MRTAELLNKLNESVYKGIDYLKRDYARAKAKETSVSLDELRAEIRGFCYGLQVAGTITDRERQALYVFMTL